MWQLQKAKSCCLPMPGSVLSRMPSASWWQTLQITPSERFRENYSYWMKMPGKQAIRWARTGVMKKRLRAMESDIHSVPGATGAIYAIRRELFEPLAPGNNIG